LPDQLRNLNAQSKVAVIIAGDERSQLQPLVDVLGALQRSGIAATSITTKAK
jgi:biopolymer transport protein ExbD